MLGKNMKCLFSDQVSLSLLRQCLLTSHLFRLSVCKMIPPVFGYVLSLWPTGKPALLFGLLMQEDTFFSFESVAVALPCCSEWLFPDMKPLG